MVKELARVIKERGWFATGRCRPALICAQGYETISALSLNYSFMSLGLGDEDTVKMPHEIVGRAGQVTTQRSVPTLLSRLGFSTIITTFTYSQGNRRISHLMRD